MKAASEQGGVWPPAPKAPLVASPPRAKSGVPYLSLAGLLIGLCANVFVFGWCAHVESHCPVYPGPVISHTIFNPVLAAAVTAALVGLPLSAAGKAGGSRVLSWVGVGLNVLSLFSAYFWSGLTAMSWE